MKPRIHVRRGPTRTWSGGPANLQNLPRESALVARAREFATRAHLGQVRKYTNDPYIVHPASVVELLRTVPHTDEMLAAGVAARHRGGLQGRALGD